MIVTSSRKATDHRVDRRAQAHLLAERTKTQSPSPLEFPAGGVNDRVPEFANGEPDTSEYLPFVGSNHCAREAPASFPMSTEIVRAVGKYAIARVPSEVAPAVT
jgi:hypothetical protein